MLKSVTIKNFRSISNVERARLAPITVLYGPTASGKSTLLYALVVLKNFLQNPNRQADGFFHLGFMDLGGFDACIFNHEAAGSVLLGIACETGGHEASYDLSFSKTAGRIRLGFNSLDLQAQVSIPYGVNQSFPFDYVQDQEEYTINWNGITSAIVPKKPTAESQNKAQEIAVLINSIPETIKELGIAPHKRGFFKPNYSPTTPSANPTSEDEVASIIMNDPHMAARISTYVEDIFGRDFRIYTPPGTATVFFQTTDKRARVPVNLVNDGFGVNQVVYLLAKMYQADIRTLLIEEPEVHLHPTVIRNFARAICNFVKEENKQLILTTHSDQFLLALLNAVSDKIISSDEIACYLASKDRKESTLKEEKVHANGQIEDGLASFMEAEIQDLKKFLKVKNI